MSLSINHENPPVQSSLNLNNSFRISASPLYAVEDVTH
jgi:hypothetical protein